MQHLLLVEVSGEKNRPYFFRAMFSSSSTTPGCTLAHLSFSFISTILLRCRLTSMTMPLPTTCPAIDVPPARGIRHVFILSAILIASTMSFPHSGNPTPRGISLYALASVAYAILCNESEKNPNISLNISIFQSFNLQFFISTAIEVSNDATDIQKDVDSTLFPFTVVCLFLTSLGSTYTMSSCCR